MIILKPHLTEETASELLAAAADKSTSQVEELLKCRFPQRDLPATLEALPVPPPMLGDQVSAQTVGDRVVEQVAPGTTETPQVPHASASEVSFSTIAELSAQTPRLSTDDQLSARTVATPTARPKVSPLSDDRFAFQFSASRRMRDKFRSAQELLSHQLPSGDMAEVFERALDQLIAKLEQRKFGATSRPRTGNPASAKNPRHIPSHVKRAVWKRDGAQCTFVSDDGHRCDERRFLEFDHITEVARGGHATVDGIRLRCRTHNQFTAECTFGAEFMAAKRGAAWRAAGGRAGTISPEAAA